MHNRLFVSLCLIGFSPLCADDQPASELRANLMVRQIYADARHVEYSVWSGSPDGDIAASIRADQQMPAASCIKTAILIELFAAYADDLSQIPPDARKILSSRTHPALNHFKREDRAEISRALSKASVLDLGSILMTYKDRQGRKYSNAVYNAGSNLAMALLGGPQKCTEKLHARSDDYAGISLQRYMLIPATSRSDNTCTAKSLGALYRDIINGAVPGLSEASHREVRKSLSKAQSRSGTDYSQKNGALGHPQVVATNGGWARNGEKTLIFVFLTHCKTDGNTKAQLSNLQQQMAKMRDRLVVSQLLNER